jgi:RNA polymerase sigma-70 factor (ECF subfamily)
MSTPELATVLTSDLRDRLHAFILARVRDPHLAQDLTQDTLFKAGRALITARVENLDGWLFRIARNTVTDHFRSSRDQVEWQESAHGDATSQNPTTGEEEEELRQELAKYVRQVVEQLPEPYGEALRMAQYEGLSQREIAARLGISLSCAKSRVQRARAEVRRIVEECCRVATDPYGQVTECERRLPTQCAC